jgi:site-specific DNA recombinase
VHSVGSALRQAVRRELVAPLGYRNESRSGVRVIVPDEKAPLIRHGFELMVSGSYTSSGSLMLVTALGLITDSGKPLSRQTWSHVLRNEVYAGWVVSKKHGIRARAVFEPLVSQEAFDKVQVVLKGKRPVQVPRKKQNESFPLKGTVRCGSCGKLMTAGFSTGRNKQRYGFYQCWAKACMKRVIVGSHKIEADFVNLLTMAEGSLDLLDQLPSIQENLWCNRNERLSGELKAIRRRVKEKRTLKQRLVLLFASDKLSEVDFNIAADEIEKEIQQLESLERAKQAEVLDLETLRKQDEMSLRHLVNLWKPASHTLKQELQAAMFPEGLLYSRERGFFETGNTHLHEEIQRLLDSLEEEFSSVKDGVPGGIRTHVIRSHSPAFHR